MKAIQFLQVTPEQLQNAIIEGVKTQLEDLKKFYQPKEPKKYLTRTEVSEMLSVDISTVHNMCKRNILQKYQISGRVLFLRSEVEASIVKLNK
tara:strand:+ start:39213 stop:39491 length:279 start_codon:yes stop_codon:yes gene_type:complete